MSTSILEDVISELREELTAMRKQRGEVGDIAAEYESQIATATKRLAKAQRAIDDREPGRPIDPGAFDLVEKRRNELDDVQARAKAEADAKKKFLADWRKRTTFGLPQDAEQAWRRERVKVMESSLADAVDAARNSPMYASF